MAIFKPTQHTCSICGKQLLPETCTTDVDGGMVHELCNCLPLTDKVESVVGYQGPDLTTGRFRSWREIAMDVLGEKDRQRWQELLEELEIALAARELERRQGPLAAESCCLPHSGGMAYENIVDQAVRLMRSDYASLQMLFPERGEGGELRLLAFRGFNPQAARFWEWVRADSKSTCGIALRDAQRVVAADIARCDFMADSEDQQVYLRTGIHACQTTPLITRRGNIVGMISTHWRSRHQPSPADFRRFDILARQTADLIDRSQRARKT